MSAARFWLWIDEVGGFVICTGETVTIGQPTASNQPTRIGPSEEVESVEVPILADISRRHAQIRRQGEGYGLETAREVRVDGRSVERRAALARDCLIELGRDVKLRFRQPHAWSLSARLDLASRHRTQPTTDGVLLVHDTLVLGPDESSHVVCPRWERALVLIWQGGRWWCQPQGEPWEANGAPVGRETLLELPARLVGPPGTISLTEWSNLGAARTK